MADRVRLAARRTPEHPPYTLKAFPRDDLERLKAVAHAQQRTIPEAVCWLLDQHDLHKTQRMNPEPQPPPEPLFPAAGVSPLDVALRVMELGAIRGNGGVARLARELVRGYLEPHAPPPRRQPLTLKLVAQP